MHITRRTRSATLVLVATTLIACGGGGGDRVTSPPPGDDRTIAATSSLAFNPGSLRVNAGDVVTFAFGGVGHNVFFDAQAGAPANITGTNANLSVQRTFATAGTYTYSCHIHPTMRGQVVVQ